MEENHDFGNGIDPEFEKKQLFLSLSFSLRVYPEIIQIVELFPTKKNGDIKDSYLQFYLKCSFGEDL